ncbi:hypothetical protein PPL_12547 [Heterostelium album PN500]|uniref:Uncharacterized protein n=1 Tax=Heterostelium pallidum (strain ATCC 26659 / Pp 5 / PN500) TaxID=670386 RepID=D3BMX4_HETP5|nr:hypothetical protein PPL_12547 [Heterostelium album PN500]EFA77336.1 hypothetical protein PPL_12547 [Heterostelium album PN500]|eukprot:XP_020429465.1 hypothetical protein PPL_12547 [Heterostelium album PN500]
MFKIEILFIIFIGLLINVGSSTDIQEQSNIQVYDNVNNLTLFSSNTIITPNSEALSLEIQKILDTLPRYDFHFQKIDTIEFDPSNSSYIQSLIVTGSPFALISGLIILSLIFGSIGYMIHRFLIRPRRKFSLNLETFELKENPSWKGYCWTSFTIFFLFSIFGLLLVGLFINIDLDNAITMAIDSLNSSIQERSDIESRIIDETRKLSIYHKLPYDALEVIQMTNEIVQWTNTSQQYIHHYEKIRFNYVFGSIMSMFAICTIGLIAVMFRHRSAIVIFIILGLSVSTVIWLIPAGHVPLGVVVSDVCPQIQTLIQNSVPEEMDPYIDFFLTCNDSSIFEFVTQVLNGAITDTETRLSLAIQHHYPQKAIQKLEFQLKELNDLSIDAKDILNCNITSATYLSVQNIVCIEILNSSSLMTFIFIIVGIIFIASFITSCKLYGTIDTYRSLYDTENFSTEEEDDNNLSKPLMFDLDEDNNHNNIYHDEYDINNNNNNNAISNQSKQQLIINDDIENDTNNNNNNNNNNDNIKINNNDSISKIE